jgi:hypothetical protein|tara:strand:- start:113 stop:301 length:189 start_codon:yes stop_codon:yes gene_type:complete
MKRTVTGIILTGIETNQYFHATPRCLRHMYAEIRVASDISVLPELSEQERRMSIALQTDFKI